jgi:hypothetical protein
MTVTTVRAERLHHAAIPDGWLSAAEVREALRVGTNLSNATDRVLDQMRDNLVTLGYLASATEEKRTKSVRSFSSGASSLGPTRTLVTRYKRRPLSGVPFEQDIAKAQADLDAAIAKIRTAEEARLDAWAAKRGLATTSTQEANDGTHPDA